MSIYELIDNLLQIAVTLIIFLLCCSCAFKHKKFLPLQYLAGASISWFCGALFWTMYFVIQGDFPYYFSASEICFMGFYLFIISLCIFFLKSYTKHITLKIRLLASILPIYVVIGIIVCYCLVGGLIWILYYSVPLCILAYTASLNALIFHDETNLFRFHLALVLFVIFCNTMYIISSFGYNKLYVFFDILLTCTWPFIFYYIKKESKS